MTSELLVELSVNIAQSLVEEILEHYTEMKKRFRLGDLVPAAETAGWFSESVMKCLLYLYDGTLTSKMGLSFENAFNSIMSIPKPDNTIDEYKFRLIPQVAKSVYTIRNKKKVAHARGERLLFVDLIYIVQACDWIIASFLYVSHRVNEDDALRMMIDIMELDTPLVQEIEDFFVLTTTRLTVREGLLVLLYRLGRKADRSEIVKHMRLQYSKSQTYKAINDANEDKLLFLNPKTNTMTLLPKGRVLAEKTAVELQRSLL